ncbi:hypothetical protein [uncultured Polaribacter sp.]|uniref:hypothetical protein n=1 Tax=uncultured Polaribacter sp. TaxID=174711 RepID=UPI0030DCE44C|tara:strand:+ start:6220 stop:7011 length:792 start_codon:yes stop_codon:yes gene_type:complete
MIKKIIFILVLLIGSSVYSQQIDLKKYQYIVVADRFDFVKETDQYQTSSLTKFLLKKKGFEVFLSNEVLPDDLIKNRCLALFVSVKDESSLFNIKSIIEFKDCYGELLFTSDEGKSKEKEYQKGYQEAIRRAYETMTDFEYSYNPAVVEVKEVKQKDVNILKEATNETVVSKNVMTPKINVKTTQEKVTVTAALDVLYAQAKTNGFQLVNTSPEVVFLILKTNVKDVFVIKDKNGILYKVGEFWVAEFYENDNLVTKNYQIKF